MKKPLGFVILFLVVFLLFTTFLTITTQEAGAQESLTGTTVMESIKLFLERQPLLVLFLVVGLGYAIGGINIKGFSLGVGAVLFSGLAVGALVPKAQPPGMVGTLGLVLFLYGIGVQFGKQFFAGLASANGRRYNLLALLALLAATGVTIAEMTLMRIPAPYMAGLFAGSGTNAAAMQAAMEAAKNNEPAIGYSVAFPFGLLGAILCMYFVQLFLKPKIDIPTYDLKPIEVAIRSSDVIGRTLGEVTSRLPAGVQVMALRVGDKNILPAPGLLLGEGDVVCLSGNNSAALESALLMLGEHAPGSFLSDRGNLDYVQVFASKGNVVGLRLSELKFPEGIDARIIQVRRGDADLMPAPDLTLEFGDRVGLISARSHFELIRKFFGNSIRSTTEFSYISLGIGMVLGVLFGVIPFPIPVLGTLKVGIAGGVLIVALILGKLRRTWGLTWTMPLSANLILRNFGISIFLAQVGMSSGPKFVAAVQQSGMTFLIVGALILFALALIPLLIGHYLMRIPFDDLLGITSGVTGTPAIPAYAYRVVPSDRVDICYAMIYPTATISKIIIVQILIAMGAG